MLNANNPAVNLATRFFLRGLIDDAYGLDEPTIVLLGKAVDEVKAVGPSGWVFLLARSLGAPHADAMEAASFAELYYAMCSFTDDVQDGDADEYMGLEDPRLLINTVAQLICVTVVRGQRFASRIGGSEASLAISRSFLDGAVMLRGQRIELLRDGWSTKSYREVAELSAGRQFDVYFRAAALAAGVSAEPLLNLSNPLALLVQIRHDRQSSDERLLGLPEAEVAAMVKAAFRDLLAVAGEAPEASRRVIDAMVEFARSVTA